MERRKVTAAVDYSDLLADASGAYFWLTPDERSTVRLLRLLRSAPFKTYDGTELHCTILHATELVANVDVPTDRVYSAKLAFIDNWTDHKGREILVLRLDSPDLKALHTVLTSQGLQHGYPEYNPHITIAKGIDLNAEARLWLTDINKELETQNVEVRFSPQLRATPVA